MQIGIFRRIGLFILELFIFSSAVNTVGLIFPSLKGMSNDQKFVLFTLSFVAIFIAPMLVGDKMQTLGMRLMKIHVVNLSPGLPRLYFILRYYFYWFLFFWTSSLIIFSKKRVTVYDKLASARLQFVPVEDDKVAEPL